jgi:flagellar motor switch protein FliM
MHMAQWEIDALLQNVSGGPTTGWTPAVATPAPGRKAQPYDFGRPSRFSKEHLRALQTIYEQFARSLSSSLSSYLRLNVRVHVTTAEQATIDEYIEQLPSPTVVYLMRMPPLEGPVILEVGLGPVLASLDRLCGGPGIVTDHRRSLTDIERSLLLPIGRYLLNAVTDAWRAIIQLDPAIDDVVLNPQAVRTAGPNEIVALLVLEFAVGDVVGTISVCLPHVVLEPVIPRLHTQAWNVEQNRREQLTDKERMSNLLFEVPLDVVVDLGEVEVPASAVTTLREGDVIRLSTPASGKLVFRVDGRPTFFCRPGISAGNLAVQIVT